MVTSLSLVSLHLSLCSTLSYPFPCLSPTYIILGCPLPLRLSPAMATSQQPCNNIVHCEACPPNAFIQGLTTVRLPHTMDCHITTYKYACTVPLTLKNALLLKSEVYIKVKLQPPLCLLLVQYYSVIFLVAALFGLLDLGVQPALDGVDDLLRADGGDVGRGGFLVGPLTADAPAAAVAVAAPAEDDGEDDDEAGEGAE